MYTDKHAYSVYTVEQVNTRINPVNIGVQNVRTTLNNHMNSQSVANTNVQKQIQEVETRFNNLVNESVNKLPQRLLSEQAKNLLKEAILAELRNEISAIRSDMQKQIDDLKR